MKLAAPTEWLGCGVQGELCGKDWPLRTRLVRAAALPTAVSATAVSSLCFFRGQRAVGHSGLNLINAHTQRACVGSKQRIFVWTG